jgi:hypothetical protein
MRAYHWFFIIGVILLTYILTGNSLFYTSIVLLVISIIGAILHRDDIKKEKT